MASLFIEAKSDILSKWQQFSQTNPILHLITKIHDYQNMPDGLQQYPTENVVLILSKLPEFLRESMIRSRLEELTSMDSKTREEFIDSILIGLTLAEEDALRKVIRTWLIAMSRLQSSKIVTIFSAYMNIYKKDPTLSERDYFKILFEVYQSLDENQRTVLRDCLVEVVFNHHLSKQILRSVPPKVRLALGLR
jgi:hypothetical protein